MLLQWVRVVWGAVLMLAPRAVLDRAEPATPGVVRVTRVLGARHLVEALILTRSDRDAPPRWPVAVDVAHGASMVGLAACSRRLRRDALGSAAAAALLAAWAEAERRRAAASQRRQR